MSKPLKKRDIPTEDRPVAYMNFVNTLGYYRAGHTAMIGMGEQYLQGKDYFGATKYVHFYVRLLKSIESVPDGIKQVIARDYKKKISEQIKCAKLPKFIENCLLSLISTHHKLFCKESFNDKFFKRNTEQSVQVSDTTDDDSSTEVGTQKIPIAIQQAKIISDAIEEDKKRWEATKKEDSE